MVCFIEIVLSFNASAMFILMQRYQPMRSSLFLYGSLILSAIALSGCAGQSPSSPTPPPTSVNVQLSWFHQSQFSGFYAAVDQKYYQEEGLDITISNGGINDQGYINPMEQVMQDKAQFGLASTNEILKAQAAGQPLVA